MDLSDLPIDGPSVYSWNILKTVETTAYKPEEWNLLQVRFQENGKILCSVNQELAIEVIDIERSEGFIGLCKFREPTASFRNFRFSKRFSNEKVNPQSIEKVRELTRNLSPKRIECNGNSKAHGNWPNHPPVAT